MGQPIEPEPCIDHDLDHCSLCCGEDKPWGPDCCPGTIYVTFIDCEGCNDEDYPDLNKTWPLIQDDDCFYVHEEVGLYIGYQVGGGVSELWVIDEPEGEEDYFTSTGDTECEMTFKNELWCGENLHHMPGSAVVTLHPSIIPSELWFEYNLHGGAYAKFEDWYLSEGRWMFRLCDHFRKTNVSIIFDTNLQSITKF